MLENYWVLILIPLFGFAINGIFGRRFSRQVIAWLSCSTVGLSFLICLLTFWEFIQLPVDKRTISRSLFTWIQSGNLVSEFSFLLDPLSMVMILVVTGVGFLIHVYSVEYMAGEEGYYRYFSYLNLFIFMMSVLVLADNYLLMFVGWEGVGLCSYLLIGYYFEKRSAGDAAKKAFIVNRIGDVGFIIGIFLIFRQFESLEYLTVFRTVSDQFPEPTAGFGVLGAITLLLFIGATGKSAQIPLYVWLPDAMEGPTPVSALIHAATMVTAGVYMIARSAPLYTRAPETLFIVAAVGISTALLAALIAMAQRDIKKVLAYSTISQLGYMFLAVGVGAFSAGIFHLMTHAFFKALLFLGSGSVILALHHEQDLMKMGGLRKYLRVTFYTMWIATLAIAGVPLFSGFFSKEEILWKAYSSPLGNGAFWFVGVLVAGLTAFYMFRLIFLVFYGAERFEEAHHESTPHSPTEPSSLIKVPFMILAFFSIVAGFVGLPEYLGTNRLEGFLAPSFRYMPEPASVEEHGHFSESHLALIAILVTFFGIAAAYQLYIRDRQITERLAARFSLLYQLIWRKFFVDEMYDWMLVRSIRGFSRKILWKSIDVNVIDGLVNGTASLMQTWSHALKRMQSGYARVYATWILGGAILIFLYYYLTSF
ncbi:NADH-quinone oxidoreductase subunit L [Acidobacteria bacterium AH-259-G07]|nr:NADH-quinone oxidoreductase subunit L [Acidobacteria bacterium AH-259-G07]